MTTETKSAPSWRRLVLTVVQFAVAGALLTLLLTRIPWGDEVVLTREDGATRTVPIERADGDPESLRLVAAEGWELDVDAEDGQTVTAVRPPSGLEDWAGASGELKLGLRGCWRRLEVLEFLLAVALALSGTATQAVRFRMLLSALGLRISFGRALQLGLAGLASSQVLLGSVGGDLVKGALVARDDAVDATLAARTRAVFAVVMDRIVGLASLLTIGTFASLQLVGQGRGLASLLSAALGALLVGIIVVLWLARHGDGRGSGSVVRRVLSSVEQALAVYRTRAGVLIAGYGLSFVSHSLLIFAIAWLGRSLGMELGVFQYFVLIPVVETVQALPISPAGWGVAEGMYVALMSEAGEPAALALSLALTVRAVTLSQALIGVPGLVVLLRRKRASSGPGSA